VDPAPPPITIVNPNAPEGAMEVIGSDGGRRLSAYQKAVALLTAAIVALLVTGVQRVRHVRHEDALDAAARDGVSLEVRGGEERSELQLLSRSSGDVTVLSVGFVGDGYRERRQEVRISPQSFAMVTTPDAKNCRTSLFDSGPKQVRVTVRTSRGDVVTRTLRLGESVSTQVQAAERYKCQYLLPEEAVGADVLSSRREGRDVVVVWRVLNFGRFPVTVVGINPPAGLAATTSLPVTLDRAAFFTGHSKPVTVTVRLRVTDCAAFAAGFVTFPDDIEVPGLAGFSVPRELLVEVQHEYAEGVTSWAFGFRGFETDDDLSLEERIRPSQALRWLEQSCDPALFARPDPTY
jgi:hypothetical protein